VEDVEGKIVREEGR